MPCGDIEEAEAFELPKQPLVSPAMRNEMGGCFKAGIHVTPRSPQEEHLRKAKKETGETCRRNSGGSAGYRGRPRKPWPAESPLGPPVRYKRNGPCPAPFRSTSNPGWPEQSPRALAENA